MTILQTLLHACGLDEQRCGACRMPSCASDSLPLCPDCRAAVRCARKLCCLCGAPLPLPDPDGSVCACCVINPPPWRRLYTVGTYEGLLRDLLLRAKYRADRSTCRLLGRMLAEKLDARADAIRPDLILPVPLHPARLRQRGFNQCQEIAEPVSRLLGIPRRPDLARRIVATPPQTGLHRRERLRNLERAFCAAPEVRGKHLLILDDTITTGTTLRRLANCLLQAGAAEITAAAIAVVPPHAPPV